MICNLTYLYEENLLCFIKVQKINYKDKYSKQACREWDSDCGDWEIMAEHFLNMVLYSFVNVNKFFQANS